MENSLRVRQMRGLSGSEINQWLRTLLVGVIYLKVTKLRSLCNINMEYTQFFSKVQVNFLGNIVTANVAQFRLVSDINKFGKANLDMDLFSDAATDTKSGHIAHLMNQIIFLRCPKK